MKKNVVIVGGGIGGLAGAIRLASLGFRVQLFEKNERVGGKLNIRTLTGECGEYSFGTGPSLLTMPFVFDELFALAGVERSSVLDFVQIEPICRYFFPDSSRLNTHADKRVMMREIYGFASPDEAKHYERFLPTLFKLPQIDPFRTVHKAVSAYFRDARLVQLFDRYPTYNGSSPFRAPATLNIIPWVEYGFGGYYVRGGMYRLIEEMLNLAQNLGVEVVTNADVSAILHNSKRVSGIQVNNETIPADYVLCNADVVEAYNRLITGFPKRQQRLNLLEPSLSGLVFLWGMKCEFADLSHHNIFFSEDYHHEFRQIFEEKTAPDDPTVYISISSKTDTHLAPTGGENWFVLLNMPYINGQNWQHEISRMREAVLKRLLKAGIDAAPNIDTEMVLSPEDLHDLYRSNKGSIYGISSNSQMAAFMRPPNRSRELKGLYFCGGSSHPGGGVPLVALSGKMAAELIHEDSLR
jgi:phytoene desaturase